MNTTKESSTIVTCICGAEMKLAHTAKIIEDSDLGCYWLECSRCGAVSTPAITEYETTRDWGHYKSTIIKEG